MKFNFTDGEWKIIKFSDDTFAIKNIHGEMPFQYTLVADNIEIEANAQLISCAPEMIEALIEATKNYIDALKKYNLNINEVKDGNMVKNHINLIEKATGEKWSELNERKMQLL